MCIELKTGRYVSRIDSTRAQRRDLQPQLSIMCVGEPAIHSQLRWRPSGNGRGLDQPENGQGDRGEPQVGVGELPPAGEVHHVQVKLKKAHAERNAGSTAATRPKSRWRQGTYAVKPISRTHLSHTVPTKPQQYRCKTQRKVAPSAAATQYTRLTAARNLPVSHSAGAPSSRGSPPHVCG